MLFIHHLPALARIIGLLLVAVALSACSAIKLGYSNLPQFSLWWLDRYIDFSDDQEQRMREDIARIYQWHRTTELPRIHELLQRAERLAASDITPPQACAFVPEIRGRFLAVAERAEPAAVTLALNLDAAQVTHLERKYASNNRDYRKDWMELAPAEQKEKRYRQFLDRSEMIYGRLDTSQREALRRQMDRSVFDAATNLAERQRRQQDILRELRRLAGQPISLTEARSIVHGLVQRGMQSPLPQYRDYQETLIQEGCRNFAALHNSTTPQQRENAVRRIRAYQRDLQELAGQN